MGGPFGVAAGQRTVSGKAVEPSWPALVIATVGELDTGPTVLGAAEAAGTLASATTREAKMARPTPKPITVELIDRS
jgi:hypothetical protein